ncbi:MAG: hypothetical protein AAAB21_08755 [Pseudomonas chlororaphis]|uniref:hypothetical protein n=1 Tax=Pseudomonas chlororaphis TaxID=587753 RepID=UPI002367AAC3|nr:hypothetical protein [Pseudomonas chlororaphis]WDH52972.1 hypothetical protein PUP75_29300 [Pseudomonas chlororaphis]
MKIFFLGWTAQYERRMIDYLSTRHSARLMVFPSTAKRMGRYIKSINKRLRHPRVGTGWLGKLVLSINRVGRDDILVCNEGQVKRGLIPSVIASFTGKKVLLMRDLVDADFVREMHRHFDRIYSFDKDQCAAFGMEYMEQFFPFGFHEMQGLVDAATANEHAPKCFFLGQDKRRVARIEAMAQALEREGASVDFAIVRDSTSKEHSRFYIDKVLTYDDNIRRSLAADVLLEVNQDGQSGLTLRALEAAFFNKKLITTNESIKTLDFYRPENIFVTVDGSLPGIGSFLRGKSVKVDWDILCRYTPDRMLERIIDDVGTMR